MSQNHNIFEKIENAYLNAFNKNFGFSLILIKNENLDEEIPGHPPLSLGVISGGRYKDAPEYFCEDFSIIPFIPEKPTFALRYFDGKSKIQFQLVGYKIHPGNRSNPPETEDFVIGDYSNLDIAIKTACLRLLSEKLTDIWVSVNEQEMLDVEYEG